jgi:3-dehydroquinate dehydratase
VVLALSIFSVLHACAPSVKNGESIRNHSFVSPGADARIAGTGAAPKALTAVILA